MPPRPKPTPAPISDAIRARKALVAVRHFADLPDEVLDALAQRMSLRHVEAGQVVHL